jgi:Ala-tRNA(Pro) deacylase
MSMSARLKQFLDENHAEYTVLPHSPVYTAQAAAATLHVPGREVAKTVIVAAGDERLLAVLPAPYHVDLKKLSSMLHKAARLATEQEFAELFPDCELGAMPPFGNMYKLDVIVDKSLADDPEIVFNAGTHREAIRMRYADYARLAGPQIGGFAIRN